MIEPVILEYINIGNEVEILDMKFNEEPHEKKTKL